MARRGARPRLARRLLTGMALGGLVAGGAAVMAGAASAGNALAHPEATLGGTATLTAPGTAATLTTGGSATPFTVTLPSGAACSADTRTGGEHVFSYLVPAGTSVSALSFETGVPSTGYGLYTSTGSYVGAVNTAPTSGQIVGVPLDLDWASALTGGNLTVKDLVPDGVSQAWDAGLVCASSAGAVTDDWGLELTFTASTSDPDGLTWTVGAVTVPAPTVSVIEPAQGPTKGGTKVGIVGAGFTGATAVHFGAVAATGLTVISANEITVQAPAHAAGAVPITVTTPGGTSTVAAKGVFTYVPAPAVSRISPAKGSVKGGTKVTLHGTGFTGATRVTFGSTAGKRLHVVSATELTVVAPRHAKGAVTLTVTTPYGTSARTTRARFTYTG